MGRVDLPECWKRKQESSVILQLSYEVLLLAGKSVKARSHLLGKWPSNWISLGNVSDIVKIIPVGTKPLMHAALGLHFLLLGFSHWQCVSIRASWSFYWYCSSEQRTAPENCSLPSLLSPDHSCSHPVAMRAACVWERTLHLGIQSSRISSSYRKRMLSFWWWQCKLPSYNKYLSK